MDSSVGLACTQPKKSTDLAALSTKFLTLFLLAIGSTVATILPLMANWYLTAQGVNVLSWTRVVLLRLDGCTRRVVEKHLQKRIAQEVMLAAEISAASNASTSNSINPSPKTSAVCAPAGAAATVERVSESSTQNSKKSAVIDVGKKGGRKTAAANSDDARKA